MYQHILILKYLDKSSGDVRILAADFSKAFDKLPFSSIMSALVKLALPRQAIVFIDNFLSGRKQRVYIDDRFSDNVSIPSGVPQGSVLGPILFALVVDSLSPVCENSCMVKYADEVTILHCIRVASQDSLQQEWDNLEEWSDSVGLCLNFEKSCVMNCVTKRSLLMSPIFSSDGSTINAVSSLRLLGVTFSSDLSWNEHFSLIASKCFKRFYILRNLKRAKASNQLLYKCYVAFIQSLMLHGLPSFCNSPQYLINKFLSVGRRAHKYFQIDDFPHFQLYQIRFVKDFLLRFQLTNIILCAVCSRSAHQLRGMLRRFALLLQGQRGSRTPLLSPRSVDPFCVLFLCFFFLSFIFKR